MGSLLGFPRQFGLAAASFPYVRRLAVLAVAVLVAVAPLRVAAAFDGIHVLDAQGVRLGVIESDGTLDDLRITVNVGGDSIEATHVWAVLGGSELRQRTNNGYWIPWSGDKADLVDNRFAVDDGAVVFKVADGSIAADNQGITIVVGYRTGGVLKYGMLGIVPGGGS